MVLLSQFPVQDSAARTFQHFLYKDRPGALLPTDPKTGQPWYSTDDLQVSRGACAAGTAHTIQLWYRAVSSVECPNPLAEDAAVPAITFVNPANVYQCV